MNIYSYSDKDSSKNDKDKNNKNGKSNPGRSLWVTNLLPSTRAQELKHLLSRFGKVIGAKVVQSSRYPRTRCYGYVTMETRAAADLCIEKLNNTELKGQIIRVAKVNTRIYYYIGLLNFSITFHFSYLTIVKGKT